ncbi:ArsC/Spx/MgsR family protein [symbiont of Argiope bruennichi]|uniref:ArsC/Spx/MgsR family protein n=1 Tax=symbiont of Argiope bruennichi TaxID=2810479 RepID=UPI003DA31369
MFIFYSAYCCNSSKKIREWMKKNNFPFKEKNVLKNKLETDDIKKLLELSKNGFAEVISKKSKYFDYAKKNLDKMSFDEAVKFIQKYPNILRRPVVIDDEKNIKVIGFSEAEFEIFLDDDIIIKEDL